MKLDEFLEISILLDYYRNLLSQKQKMYLLAHFEEDLSLTEIAKNNNISRQAVYDNIRRGINTLKDYEKKLGFHKKNILLKKELLDLKENFNENKLDMIIEKLF